MTLQEAQRDPPAFLAYRIIRDGTTYEDLGSNYFDERDRRATLRRSVQRLERLGYKVTVEAA